MNIRLLALIVLCTAAVSAQRQRFSWQESCFKNPGLPYCSGHEFAAKGARPPKDNKTQADLPWTRDNFVVNGVDWRFADPQADWLAGFNFSDLPPSPLARRLIARFGAAQHFTDAETQKLIDGLSSVQRVVLSARGDRVVLFVTQRGAVATVFNLETGWKAVPVEGNATLIGHTDAVDQAIHRMTKLEPLEDLVFTAVEKQGNSEFWAVGSGKLLGTPDASGIKQFIVKLSVQDMLTSDVVLEFNGPVDPKAVANLPSVFGKAAIDGNIAHGRVTMEGNELTSRFSELSTSVTGNRLSALIAASRYLPSRDAAATGRTKPVIFGLDAGPKELGQPQK